MVKKLVSVTLWLLYFPAAWAQMPRAGDAISKIYTLQVTNNFIDTPVHEYLIQLNGSAVPKGLHILKRLSYDQYIVSSRGQLAPGGNIVTAGPANRLWKATDDLAQFTQSRPNKTSTVTLAVKQQSAALISHIKKFGSIISIKGNTVTLQTVAKDLAALLEPDDVFFAAPVRTARPELRIEDIDLGLNNISAVADTYPDINGAGIRVSVKEEHYDEDDLDLLGRSFTSAPASQNNSGHATIMATLIGGNGNSFIQGLGAAPAVRFTSSDFANLSPDSSTTFKNFGISLQNHSYGTGIENYYGVEAQQYDKQVYDDDTLVHVFSSGNIGTTAPTTGLYNGLTNYANLSGTFKQAKNVLVVGGTGRTGTPEGLSSAGPAYDGRIKPELVADGEDGTSGAAALVTGTVAMMQQLYKKKFGVQPPAALVKAILINTADDLATPQADRKTGYGQLNALEAVRTIAESRFKNGSVQNVQEITYQIVVPANCKELKVSLAWTDPPAALNAPYALINDLDLYVTTPAGQVILPWTLSIYPSADSLMKPAARQHDTLNNAEQITVSTPVAGTYTLHIKGTRVSTAAQLFSLAYQTTLVNRFEWTAPSGDNHLLTSTDNYLRWQSTFDNSAAGSLDVSYDHGASWQHLANVPLAQKYYRWTTPNKFTPAMLRMTVNGTVYTSPEFVISAPRNLNVGYECNDGTLLHWNAQQGATGYVVYTLKDNVMQKLLTATDTTVVIPSGIQTSKFFAVSAHGNGFEGVRSLTINSTTQGVGCYVRTLLASVATDSKIRLNLDLGSVLNLKSINWEKQTGVDRYTVIGSTTITGAGLSYSFTDEHPKAGINYYRATLTTNNGALVPSDIANAVLLKASQFTLYPNPVTTELNILAGDLNNYELKIYDIMGRVSFTRSFNGLANTIPINLMPGLYVCSIFLNGQQLYKGKMIKL